MVAEIADSHSDIACSAVGIRSIEVFNEVNKGLPDSGQTVVVHRGGSVDHNDDIDAPILRNTHCGKLDICKAGLIPVDTGAGLIDGNGAGIGVYGIFDGIDLKNKGAIGNSCIGDGTIGINANLIKAICAADHTKGHGDSLCNGFAETTDTACRIGHGHG